MSKQFTFKSIEFGDKIAYEYNSDWHGFFTGNCGSDHCGPYWGYFETFGDGLTKHSPCSPVRKDKLVDMIYSLAAHLIENPKDCHYQIVGDFENRYDEETVEFLMKFKGTKAFYSVVEKKETDSDAKLHDKRYFKTPDLTGYQGARRALHLLACTAGDRPFLFIRDILQEIAIIGQLCRRDQYGTQEFREQYDNEVFNAFRFMSQLTEAFRRIDYASNVVDSHRHNSAMRKEFANKVAA